MKTLITFIFGSSLALLSLSVLAQSTEVDETLKLPQDIAENADVSVGGTASSENVAVSPVDPESQVKSNAAGTVIEEYRSGGRLERVTIERENGIEEVYNNERNDALWSGSENELGDGKNVRSWKVGSW